MMVNMIPIASSMNTQELLKQAMMFEYVKKDGFTIPVSTNSAIRNNRLETQRAPLTFFIKSFMPLSPIRMMQLSGCPD